MSVTRALFALLENLKAWDSSRLLLRIPPALPHVPRARGSLVRLPQDIAVARPGAGGISRQGSAVARWPGLAAKGQPWGAGGCRRGCGAAIAAVGSVPEVTCPSREGRLRPLLAPPAGRPPGRNPQACPVQTQGRRPAQGTFRPWWAVTCRYSAVTSVA